MKIKELITTYKKVLEYYKDCEEKGKTPSYGICGTAYWLGNPGVYNLFKSTGYYRNYINRDGFLIGPVRGTSKGMNFRIKFIKKEIVELEKLLSEGYTDV
jgi:hypothetical protein